MAKKRKTQRKQPPEPPEAEVVEEVIAATDLEEEPKEDVEFTDTSYTSASFETIEIEIVEEPVKKKKKKKKKTEEVLSTKASEEFDWSEESLPVLIEEQAPVVEEVVKIKKKKKKDKKPVEEIPDFEKPKTWKKMNRKEREQWLVERIEQWREEMEAEKQAKLAGAKEKRFALQKARDDIMDRDIAEQETRRDRLFKICNLFAKFSKDRARDEKMKVATAEWNRFLRCDGLPDPRIVTEMNTYLHKWRLNTNFDVDELERRCKDALPLLAMLDAISGEGIHPPRLAQNYTELRLELRSQIAEAIQAASYTLLRDIEHNLDIQNTRIATYHREFKGLNLDIWVALKLPTRLKKPNEASREPVELSFPAISVSLKLPPIIDTSCLCVRAARSSVDLLSESSRSFALAAEYPNTYEDLFDLNDKELIECKKLKEEYDIIRNKFYKESGQRIKELEKFLKHNPYTKNEAEKEELENLYLAEPPPLPEPRDFIAESNRKAFNKYLKTCLPRSRTGEVNLRKYRIIGGVLNLDILLTPPQSKRISYEVYITTLQLPKNLEAVKYQVQYRTPAPPPPDVIRTPEEVEAELKKIEAAYEKLALVHIDLPQNAMWFEPPVISQWQESRKLWTTNYINDFKFNEDKLTVQFRTGILWPIGIATLRYSNMPYQGWDVRPNPDGKGVLVSVTGVAVTVTWLCRGKTVRLQSIANAASDALREHYDKPYNVQRMMRVMREASCDFFPEFDAHNYVEGSCPKDWVLERHIYHAMAFMSRAYNFQWSRWNATTSDRIIIMQIREAVDQKRENKLQLVYSDPQRTTVLKGNEMMQEFSDEPGLGLRFYPDLFALNLQYGSVDARRLTFKMKFRLVETIFELLQELKILSFS